MFTYRGTMTMLHGLVFGAFFLFAAFALVVELVRLWHPHHHLPTSSRGRRMEGIYLAGSSMLGWMAVFSGTYLIYPWYRASPLAGADVHGYPRSLLLASTTTASLHTIGMEWKEHVAFIAPMVFTAISYILFRYPEQVRQHAVRRVLLVFGLAGFLAAAIPGITGALLNKAAPTEGSRSGLAIDSGDRNARS